MSENSLYIYSANERVYIFIFSNRVTLIYLLRFKEEKKRFFKYIYEKHRLYFDRDIMFNSTQFASLFHLFICFFNVICNVMSFFKYSEYIFVTWNSINFFSKSIYSDMCCHLLDESEMNCGKQAYWICEKYKFKKSFFFSYFKR